MAIENYKPDAYLEAVYQLDVKSLEKRGIELVLVDLDNTLIAWNNPDGTPEMHDWLQQLEKAGIQVCVLSNNHYKRVKRAVAPFGIDFINDAMKPFTKGIKKAFARYAVKPENTLLVGDQRMTDIRAAHRAGIRSVLVKPLLESDHWPTKFNRAREHFKVRALEKKYGKAIYQDKL
jgi:HAD superfamily phosphatase (TIGR01668 family)